MSFTNPFSPTTTGGAAGQFVFNDIVEDQEAQSTSIALSRAEKYEAEDQERVDNYVVVLEALDQEALNKVNSINGKKQEILTIITNAYNTSAKGSGTFQDEATAQGDTTAAKVVDAAGITTFTYACSGSPVVCDIGAKAPMYADTLAAWYYPNVESLNASVTFYRQGESYTAIGATNLGIGVTAYEFGDADGVTPDVSGIVTTSSSLGDYYYFTDIDSIIAGSATSITNLITEIETLRTEVSDFLSGISTGTNKVRKLKSNAQVDLWYEKKGQLSDTTDYVGGLNTMNTNKDIIQDYDG
jgi:predicted DNA-binding ribbon-helix-helix protein